VAARKQKQRRLSAQAVEDCRLHYEAAAGIDVAKESAVVCVRMPPAAGKKHRTSHLQTVPATVPAIAANTGPLLGERFRRLSCRPGGGGRKKAGCAVGRSILIIVWHLLLGQPLSSYPRRVPLTSADAVRGCFPVRRRLLCVRALGAVGDLEDPPVGRLAATSW
jgi:hypothetical protein